MRRKISRRKFVEVALLGGAGLTIGVSFASTSSEFKFIKKISEPDAKDLGIYLTITPQSDVIIRAPKSEMGQGIHASIAMMVAEELDLDWDKIQLHTAPYQNRTSAKLGNQNTGGSTSIKDTWHPLRKAGALARELLLQAASVKWRVPKSECSLIQGKVTHNASGRSSTLGELVELASALEEDNDISLKPSTEFKIIGKKMAPLEKNKVVTGNLLYGIDVDLPNLHYAVIERSPVYGGKIKTVSDLKSKSIPGVIAILPVSSSAMGAKVRNGVAVVASNFWSAVKGREALEIEWEIGSGVNENSTEISSQLRGALGKEGRVMSKIGNPDELLSGNSKKIEATYELPFLYHAQMEPMNCTAHYQDGHCTVLGPIQFPQWAAGGIAQTLGLKSEDVTINVTNIGGAFGRRINFDYAVEAAIIAKELDVPVKVIWTREDDIRHGFFRPASAHKMIGSLDDKGDPNLWLHHIASTTINVFADSIDPSNECLGGGAGDFPYAIPNIKTMYSGVRSMITRGWWRSVEYSFNVFAMESFIDELANESKKDPVEFRLQLLESRDVFEVRHPFWGTKKSQPKRQAAVLQLAAEKSGWFSPEDNRHLGAACLQHFGLDSFIGLIAEVSASEETIKVNKITAAVDCGLVVNPSALRAQIEGGIAMGLSSSLGEEITVRDGRVEQSRLGQYKLLRIGQMPEIDIHIIENQNNPGGAGELSLPVVAPALCNAIFQATKQRIRKLPIS